MIGAIIGDIVGSRFEFRNTDKYDFELFTKDCDFTDDTICTIAIADAILHDKERCGNVPPNYQKYLRRWCRKYPNPKGCYGGSFGAWVNSPNPKPYNSFGNGAAMRVSPVAWAYNSAPRVADEAATTASCTHNHTEGVCGATATALAIFSARSGWNSPDWVARMYYGDNYASNLIKRGQWDETCQGCVPLAIHIATQATGFEDALRTAIAYGGDSDTLGAIVCSIAEARFGVPAELEQLALSYLPAEMKSVITKFRSAYET